MLRLTPLLTGLLLAAALAGCGSAASGPGSAGTASQGKSSNGVGGAPRAYTANTTVAVKAPAAPVPTVTAAPADTTPRSVPAPKRRRGPRKVSVTESSSPIHVVAGRSAARQLVEAWRGGPVPASDRDVALVQRHLTSLAAKCIESQAAIAGYVRAGIARYRAHDVLESPVEFSRALDSATPPGRSNCKGILRTLLAQVEQG